jgi:hypothetical protein
MSRVLVPTIVLCFAVIALTGCFSSKPVIPTGAENGAAPTLGSIEVSSRSLGQLTVAPTACTAGSRQFFLGGDFADEKNGVVVRLAVDPVASPAVRVFSAAAPFDKSIVFHRKECSVFHFSLDSTGWSINRVEDYRLTLNVDCSRNDESVRGTVSATHCH